jgi:CO/xanthine dehydrogenase Mo-binding subunit
MEAMLAASAPYRIIGQPIPRVEGVDKVTGRARFAADFVLPGTLWATSVHSPLPHACILSVDTTRARAIPGVRAILTGADFPGRLHGRALRDIPFLCADRVRFVGDKIAVVAAETVEAAEEAAAAIDVEYEELPAVFDPLEAMDPGAPIIHPDARSYVGFPKGVPADVPNLCSYKVWAHGDIVSGMAAADRVIEHTFTTPLIHQGYLEPSTSLLAIDDAGRIQVWPANKNPFPLRQTLAEMVERPERDIVIYPTVVGGDFGSKGGPAEVPMAYFLARATGQPIKFIPHHPRDVESFSHRHPAVVTIRSGVKRDGTIVAREVRVVFNSGAYGGVKPAIDGMPSHADHAEGPYAIPNVRVEAMAVYTNTPPSGYMRAPGQPQVAFAHEAHMDLLAQELGLDPLELRLRNAVRHGPDGAVAPTHEILQRASEAIGWTQPKPPHIGRGLAMVGARMGTGEGAGDVTLNEDGTLTVLTCLPDVGTGAPTVMGQIVAEEFGVTMDRVRVIRADTDALPTDVGSGADRVTYVAGHAAIAVSRKLKAQLTPLAASMLGAPSAEWDGNGWHAPGGARVSLEELALEMVPFNEELAHAQVVLAQPQSQNLQFMAQAAEVEVDMETGQVRVRKMVSVQESGTIINALGHQGQVDGGMVQGLGYGLCEELVLDEGRIINTHLGEYKLPTVRDIPALTTINVAAVGVGPYEAKAIAELPCVPTAPAIANAVADAIGAPIKQLPITAERVLAAMENQQQAPSPLEGRVGVGGNP